MKRSARRHGIRGLVAMAIVALVATIGASAASAAVTLTPAVGPPPTSQFPELPGLDWSRFGYEWSEFFVAGDAQSYNAASPLPANGVWAVTPDATTAPFKTRLRVMKPSDPSCFNGTVYVEWFNVSGGQDAAPSLGYGHNELTDQCAAFVGVSAQIVGVNALRNSFPTRYGAAPGADLVHPGDSYSYSIFSQAGQTVRDNIDTILGTDFDAQRFIAMGQSQSAGRLVTYVNALAPQGIYDGYLIHNRGAGGAALRQTPLGPITVSTPTLIRTDLSVPVFTYQSEGDSRLPRQDDTPLLRWWEVAGTSHIDAYSTSVGSSDYGDLAGAQLLFSRMIDTYTGPFGPFGDCTFGVNAGGVHWVFQAALHHLNEWVTNGTLPPIGARLATSDGTGAGALVLDANGNATGGIRTPHVDVPIAVLAATGNTPINPGINFCGAFGTTTPFSAAKLAQLYKNHGQFVSKWSKATDAAVAAGFILPGDGDLVQQSGATSGIGKK
jgi:hypothetical protein